MAMVLPHSSMHRCWSSKVSEWVSTRHRNTRSTGCSLAQGDEARRALGDTEGQQTIQRWFVPRALSRGYSTELVGRLWEILTVVKFQWS